MASLRQDERGNYVSRRKLPTDVRDEYGRLFGQRHEAKFFQPASTDRREAQRQFSEWSAEVDGNIIAIRAARDGTGLSLTPAQARKLAGGWYDWFIAKHAHISLEEIEWRRDDVIDAFTGSGRHSAAIVTEEEYARFSYDELWHNFPEVRQEIRPVLADVGQIEQFLAARQLALTNAARNLFLTGCGMTCLPRCTGSNGAHRGTTVPTSTQNDFPRRPKATTAASRHGSCLSCG
jgi:hypothetical protein